MLFVKAPTFMVMKMNPLLRILAFSSSKVAGGAYLEQAAPVIHAFLGSAALRIAFIPFASVDDYAEYGRKVAEGLKKEAYSLQVAGPETAAATISHCDAIMVGGGNTFKLLHDLYRYDLVDLIRSKVQSGTPYIGWSAGSNLTGLSIRTTNDMPILEPHSFEAFGFFPFQINPHYYNEVKENFHGETRDQRLEEFIRINPGVPVVCLPEGSYLHMQENTCSFKGPQPGLIMNNQNGSLVRQVLPEGILPL